MPTTAGHCGDVRGVQSRHDLGDAAVDVHHAPVDRHRQLIRVGLRFTWPVTPSAVVAESRSAGAGLTLDDLGVEAEVTFSLLTPFALLSFPL